MPDTEWYTPSRILDAARETLGSIDLDPASCAAAQARVQARRFLSRADDALRPDADWTAGTCWLNPPYGAQLPGFAARLLAELREGRIGAAIWLSNCSTDTVAVQSLLAGAAWICLPRGRIFFDRPGGRRASPARPSILIGLGRRIPPAPAAMARLGPVLRPVLAHGA